jgi:hypothetical protein
MRFSFPPRREAQPSSTPHLRHASRASTKAFFEEPADSGTVFQDEYSILNSKHFIGIHGYMIVYSVASKQSFEMARIIRDKILNHLVSLTRAIVSATV